MRRGTAKKRLEEGKFPIPFIKIGRGNMCHIDDVEAYATAAKITAAKRHPIAAAALQQTRTTDIEPPRRGPGRPRK
jgi:cation transport ATPase